jgi:hypothetical protein
MQTQSIESEYSNQLLGIVKPDISLQCQAEAYYSKERKPKKQAERILELLRNNPDGLTDKELQALTGIPHNVETARRRELVIAELVEADGKREVEVNGRHMNNTIWKAR